MNLRVTFTGKVKCLETWIRSESESEQGEIHPLGMKAHIVRLVSRSRRETK